MKRIEPWDLSFFGDPEKMAKHNETIFSVLSEVVNEIKSGQAPIDSSSIDVHALAVKYRRKYVTSSSS